ncbi:hypothetical protein H072_1715 [Dactylellina haptotyla CBS 200.50]|uniref:Arrestin C-terminal-like domain-containing protein n=1 Tax=Dactylellina haptotyla (strain CBS 200.50) TaxID=1284197 RepID=S8ATH6_DACHA|nr:hypothetical protein H072_1715 [Dactylellina haptotyla CBS 200.50]
MSNLNNTSAQVQPETGSSHHAPSEQASHSSLRGELLPLLFRPKTFIRPSVPHDLLLNPIITSTTLKADIFITSPFHIGGGSVAGKLNVSVNSPDSTGIQLARVAVDLVGIEELSWTHRQIFKSLAIEFIDDNHPPPPSILREEGSSGPFWAIKPGDEVFPFNIDLPLDIGVGTYSSAGVRIRYVIFGTILFKIGNVKFLVRCCRDVAITPSIGELRRTRVDFDQEVKASEERSFSPTHEGYLKLTASISRPYWFSGGSVFVDVLVENGSLFRIGTIRIRLIRRINAYKNASDEETGNPSWTEKKTMAKSELNAGSRWTGLKGNKQDAVTCEIEIPKGQLTIPRGKFFEVQYFLVVTTCPKLDPHRKVKAILPIQILHTYSIQEALMSGLGGKPSFASFSAIRRSLPTQRPSTTTVGDGGAIRRRYTDSDLSQLEPIPITESGLSMNHVTSGVATPPKVTQQKKKKQADEATSGGEGEAYAQAPATQLFYSIGSAIPSSVRKFFS